jgi:hypothetical protein
MPGVWRGIAGHRAQMVSNGIVNAHAAAFEPARPDRGGASMAGRRCGSQTGSGLHAGTADQAINQP